MSCLAKCHPICLCSGLRPGQPAGCVGMRLASRSLFRIVRPVIRLMQGIFLDANPALRKRFLRMHGMNITILRRSCDTSLATSLAVANSHRMVKTRLQS